MSGTEQPAAVAAPAPGTPEYDAAMIAKVDESAAKALAAATESGLPVEAPAPVEPPVEAPKEAEQVLESKGLSLDEFSSEFAEKGELSKESFEKLEKAGIPKTFVDAYIEGQKALTERLQNDVFASVGGESQYRNMLAWAQTSLNAAEQDAFNKATLGSREEIMQAVGSLKNRFEGAYGRTPQLLGGSLQAAAPQGYASNAEVTQAMRDPRYRTDPAYRASVTAKLASTDF